VESEYQVISVDDPTPRYVDVFAGRMYLYLCDQPDTYPYASSVIFTSFVVLTGFILISLTVAAVSTGVKIRLQEIQKYTDEKKKESNDFHDQDIDFFLEKLESEDQDQKPLKSIELKEKSLTGIVPGEMPKQISSLPTNLSAQPSKISGSVSLAFIPILQDKKLIQTICKQMWNDVENIRKKRKDLDPGRVEDNTHGSPSRELPMRPSFKRLTNKLQNLSLASRKSQLQLTRSTQLSFPSKRFSVHKFIKEYNIEDVFVSKQNFYLFLRNILASPLYLSYLICMIIAVASCQIYCVNKDNCSKFTYGFLCIQIFLSIDVLVKVVSFYPTPKDYFRVLKNNFDFVIVTLIWVPFFYTGYGASIAGCSSFFLLTPSCRNCSNCLFNSFDSPSFVDN
jgi:hypothetical protein